MRNSIATVSISGALDEKLAAIAEAGFDAVEIFDNDLIASPHTPAEIGAMMGDLGLTCTALQPFRDFEAMPTDMRGRIFDRAERKFDVMQALRTDLMLVCSNVSPAAVDDAARRAADFHALGERAQARGLRIAYEALAWGRHVFDHRQAWATVQATDHRAVGLALDTFHSLARAIPVDTLQDIDPARIFLVQVADAPWREMDLLSWSRHFRCMPGQGDLPVLDYLTELARTGFTGGLSLEIFNDRFRATPPGLIALDGLRSLVALRDDVERRVAGRSDLPSRARCEAVEFIEFAANAPEAEALGDLFGRLGFARAGRHRSKAVTRWRQGDINLVVNAEPDSFASAYALMHGASSCAVGLRVDDVASAQARAAGLKIEAFRQSPNPGDMDLPAVVGVGGSVIYFTEARGELAEVWEHEFTPTGETARIDAGLTQIDHLAQTLHADDILSWRLYYASMFQVAASAATDIVDPSGLVHSTVLEAVGGGLRVTLTEPEGRDTLAARFLHRFFGSGLQHIALGCKDVFAAVEAISGGGGRLLDIPRNYYEDLAARFGLEAAEVERFAAHNVLYDRDDRGGEMLHAVTRAHDRRFFFELVERRGGYDGVDVLGAQVRLAAQARLKPPALP